MSASTRPSIPYGRATFSAHFSESNLPYQWNSLFFLLHRSAEFHCTSHYYSIWFPSTSSKLRLKLNSKKEMEKFVSNMVPPPTLAARV